jgi:hypothetical protein
MTNEDYLVTHLGEGKFQVKMKNNEIKGLVLYCAALLDIRILKIIVYLKLGGR